MSRYLETLWIAIPFLLTVSGPIVSAFLKMKLKQLSEQSERSRQLAEAVESLSPEITRIVSSATSATKRLHSLEPLQSMSYSGSPMAVGTTFRTKSPRASGDSTL